MTAVATTPQATDRVMTYAEAVREAIAEAMTRDERVFMLGEDIGIYGGAFGVSGDLYHRFGPERIRDTPISELGIVGAAVGAAVAGMRPIVEIQFSDFTCQAMDQIVNQAAKIHFMLGGAATVPMVLRTPLGSGTGAAAQHSQSLEAWFAHVPGLKVVMPATPADAKGLLLAAIEDPNPVLVLEHKLLYRQSGPVPEGYNTTPLGTCAVRREGTDLTIAATGVEVSRALDAAQILAEQGVSAMRKARPKALKMVSAWWWAFLPRRLSMCSVMPAWLTKPWKNSETRSTSNWPITARVNSQLSSSPGRPDRSMTTRDSASSSGT